MQYTVQTYKQYHRSFTNCLDTNYETVLLKFKYLNQT